MSEYPCRCGSAKVTAKEEDTSFPYWHETRIVEIPVRLTIHTCMDCGGEFLDSSAEDIKETAVGDYLELVEKAVER